MLQTLCGALLVENGQRYASSGAFVNQQWLWFHIAAMSSSLIGGPLVQKLSPAGALQLAAPHEGAGLRRPNESLRAIALRCAYRRC